MFVKTGPFSIDTDISCYLIWVESDSAYRLIDNTHLGMFPIAS